MNELEKFEKKLHWQLIFFMLLFTTLFVVQILLMIFIPEVRENKYNAGILGGILGSGIGNIIIRYTTIKNETKLQKAYIESKDERNRLIELKVAKFTLNVALITFGIATAVAFYIDETMAFILLGVLISVLLTTLLSQIYFKRKL